MSDWLTIEEAAKYLGISKTTLYSLAQQNNIPCNKVGKKWIFAKEKLDDWLKASKPIETFFIDTDYNILDNPSLREPQIDAYKNVVDFFKNPHKNNKAIIQIPVGCGKSGLAAILPFGIAKGRVLIISPNLTIKDGLYEALDITNRQKCFWRRMFVLEEKDMIAGPYVCTLDTGNISISEKSHIVVTNIQKLAKNCKKWLSKFKDNFFDLIIVDEGHHSEADSWKNVIERFPNAKVVHLTATPFRSDRKQLEGELIYRYPFKSATIKGYIKKIKASYVAPSELTFTDKGEIKIYTLDQVIEMKENEKFSKGIAMSTPCNINIVDNSLDKLERLRMTGTRHQLIAVACSIDHAKKIRSLYMERGYAAEVIHSHLDKDEQEKVIRDLKNGILDCIVQVQMLGEGFDHPKLSVAAIFNPYRTLTPYIQFVGRILRVIVQNDQRHPDNTGYIVTHIGMNLDKLLQKFKDLENDDKAFWEEVLSGKTEDDLPKEVKEGKTRRKLRPDLEVKNEIVQDLFEEEFSTVDDDDIIAELERKYESLGIDPSLAKVTVEQNKDGFFKNKQKAKATEPFQVLPQKKWEEAKRRLNEEVKRTAKILLNNCDLDPKGKDIPFKLRFGVNSINNFVGAIELVNKKVNLLIGDGKPRTQWTTEEFIIASDNLSSILNILVRQIKKRQGEINEQSKG